MPLQSYQLSERCSCGATFTMDHHSQETLRVAAGEWRITHKHEFPPAPEKAEGEPIFEHRDLHSETERIPGPVYIGFRPDEGGSDDRA